MKYLGAVVLAVYVWLNAFGVEPFTATERGAPGRPRHRSGGWFFGNSGFRGGK